MDLLLQSCYSTSSEEELEEESEERVAEGSQGRSIKKGNVTLATDKVAGIRQQKHVPGNWAGLCFLPIRDNAIDHLDVDRLVSKLCKMLENLGYSGHCQVHDEFHVSLSRPFYLQQANLQPFLQALSAQLLVEPKHQRQRRFDLTIDPSDTCILTNDDSTRSFLAWRVHAVELGQITNICNRILRSYQQPAFYDDPQFHVSLASFIPALDQDTTSRLIGEILTTDADEQIDCINFTVAHISIKFGTVQMFEIKL